jgi:hypothetical protein
VRADGTANAAYMRRADAQAIERLIVDVMNVD